MIFWVVVFSVSMIVIVVLGEEEAIVVVVFVIENDGIFIVYADGLVIFHCVCYNFLSCAASI